jgi:hypothetical protein
MNHFFRCCRHNRQGSTTPCYSLKTAPDTIKGGFLISMRLGAVWTYILLLTHGARGSRHLVGKTSKASRSIELIRPSQSEASRYPLATWIGVGQTAKVLIRTFPA